MRPPSAIRVQSKLFSWAFQDSVAVKLYTLEVGRTATGLQESWVCVVAENRFGGLRRCPQDHYVWRDKDCSTLAAAGADRRGFLDSSCVVPAAVWIPRPVRMSSLESWLMLASGPWM